LAVLWLYYDMPYRPTERSVFDERALLRVLGASRRIASFKAVMARHNRRLPPMVGPAPEDDPARELPTIVPVAVTKFD
jgi:hypothetical protein